MLTIMQNNNAKKILIRSSYRFFGPFLGYRGLFQIQGMLKRSIINKRSGKISVHSQILLL